MKRKIINFIVLSIFLLYFVLILLNYFNLIKNFPFILKSFSLIFEICNIVLIFNNISKFKEKYYNILVIAIVIFVNILFIFSSSLLKFTSIENVLKYNHINEFDFVEVENNFIIFDTQENKDKLKFIEYKKDRYSMNLETYNYIYNIDEQNVSIKLYDIKDNRIIIVESKDGNDLEIKDIQNNIFVNNFDNSKNKYYVSKVEKEKDYKLIINGVEYAIDLSKTEKEYLKERLAEYNN